MSGDLRDFLVRPGLVAKPAFPVYGFSVLSLKMRYDVIQMLQCEPTESNVNQMRTIMTWEIAHGNRFNATQIFQIIWSMQQYMISQRRLAICMGMQERLGATSCLLALPSDILMMISEML